MSANHTTGIITPRHFSVSSDLDNDSGTCIAAGMYRADAERLAACWNALDGLPQDALDGGWTAKGISAYAKSLEANLAAAQEVARTLASALEETLDEACGWYHESRGGDVTELDWHKRATAALSAAGVKEVK